MLDLLSQLQGTLGNNQQFANQLGIAPDKTNDLLGAIAPMITGALAKNAKSPEGASALAAALDTKHDGGIFDHLDDYLGSGDLSDGQGILRHVFGGKQALAESAVADATGVDKGIVQKALPMVAPLILGALGKEKRSTGLDVGGLASLLGDQSSRMPQAGLLTAFLDKDGDGQVKDDLLKMLWKWLLRLFGKR